MREAFITVPWIERELAEFLTGREAFPTENEFKDAGRRPLYTAMHGHGGLGYWRERSLVMGYG
ncbi:MAG: hypothetical protein WB507_01590 [Solirubrobacterales bacterium]